MRAWPGTWEPKNCPGLRLVEWLFNVQAACFRTKSSPLSFLKLRRAASEAGGDLVPSKPGVEEKAGTMARLEH